MTSEEILKRFKGILGSLYNPEKEGFYLHIFRFLEREQLTMPKLDKL